PPISELQDTTLAAVTSLYANLRSLVARLSASSGSSNGSASVEPTHSLFHPAPFAAHVYECLLALTRFGSALGGDADDPASNQHVRLALPTAHATHMD